VTNTPPPPVATLSVDGVPHCLTWSPDGTRLAIGFANGEVAQITTQGRFLWRRPVDPNLIWSIAWSPNGEHLALATGEHRRLCILSADSGNMVLERSEFALCVSWSPNAQRLVFDADDEKAKVLDVVTGEICAEISHTDASAGCVGPF
jgi:WD40 repeat protein